MDFTAHVDTMFWVHGQAAIYTPSGGDPVDVLVIPKRPDEIEDFQGVQVVASKNLFDVRKSEIAEPAEDDQIDWNGSTFLVIGKPVCKDSDRLIWTLSTSEQ